MIDIDDVIANLDTLTDKQRATWRANAERVIARGPRRNAAYAPALRLRDAIAAFEATRGARGRFCDRQRNTVRLVPVREPAGPERTGAVGVGRRTGGVAGRARRADRTVACANDGTLPARRRRAGL